VPQGSSLGPILFIIYSSQSFNVIEKHLPHVHGFTDDTQLHLSFKPDGQVSQDVGVRAVERCIADIQSWMINDRLLLNDDKTKVLLRMVPTFVSAHTFCASRKAWFKHHTRAEVDIDAINYATKYMTKRKQIFPTVTKSSLMSPYLNEEHQNSSISLTTNC